MITHSLFVGVKSNPRKHLCYIVHLLSLDGKYAYNFNSGAWSKELKRLRIKSTDTADNIALITVLIGSDVAGKLLTGRRYILEYGLVVVETLWLNSDEESALWQKLR